MGYRLWTKIEYKIAPRLMLIIGKLHLPGSTLFHQLKMVQVQQERPPFETHTSPTHINEDQLDKLIKELDSIEAVISMGFPKNHVMTTFHNQLKEKGIPFFNLESCIEAVLSHMENETRKALNLASNREIEVEVKVSTSSQHVALTEVDVVPSPSIFGDITAKTELASNQKIEEEVQTLSLQHVGLTEVDVVPSPITTQTELASNQEEIEEEVQTLSPHHVALTKVDVVPSPPISDDITTQTELASNQEIEEEVQNLSPPQAEAVTLIQAIDELKPPMSITQMVPVLKPPVFVGSSGKIGQTSLERICECKICMDAEIELVFIPCNHMVACSKCALALFICPICRTDIKYTIRPISS
ncbi:uncharacterized protein [Procambarus clarkii]|uniref:uncharacterized protein n=1 Tax=Procambarus clarkii TaxID=6728 RepID=UPI0037431713